MIDGSNALMTNLSWTECCENAPSNILREYIALEYGNSKQALCGKKEPQAIRTTRKRMENKLRVEDFQHLIKHARRARVKKYYRQRIKAIRTTRKRMENKLRVEDFQHLIKHARRVRVKKYYRQKIKAILATRKRMENELRVEDFQHLIKHARRARVKKYYHQRIKAIIDKSGLFTVFHVPYDGGHFLLN